MGCSVPSWTDVGPETLLRPKVAAALAFSDGSTSERHGYAHDVADVSRCGCYSSRAYEPLSFGNWHWSETARRASDRRVVG
jgi:hypothetical protein